LPEQYSSSLDRVVAKLGDLPALPDVVAQVLRITEDPSSEMARVSAVIQRDPALTAKILKVGNSPYYGMKQYVGTLKLALVILGVREVRNIVLGINVFDAISDGKVDTALIRDFWGHSVRVGGLSKKLGAALGLGLQGEDFISGLLHDVGKIALLRQLGPSYMRIFKASGGHSAALCKLEKEMFGFDHADAAAALAAQWNLPKTLGDAMWRHHSEDREELANTKDPRLAALVCIANVAAREDFSDPNGAPGPSCLLTEAWGLLRTPRTPEEPAARREMLARFVKEFEESPPEES